MKKKSLKLLRWLARIIGSLIFLIGLLFYVGYGWPIPSATLSFFENVWLLIFPCMFIGLVWGWFDEKIAGYILTISLGLGFVVSLLTWQDPSIVMVLPLAVGVAYLVYAYSA